MIPVSPLDALMMCPASLNTLAVHSQRDGCYLESLLWSLHLYPDEIKKCTSPIEGGMVCYVDWTDSATVDASVVDSIMSVVGTLDRTLWISKAEHLVALRRFVSSTPEVVRGGEAWRSAINLYLSELPC